MKFRIVPADEGFFDLFTQAARNNVRASEMLREIFAHYDQREDLRERIRQAENEGDEITHQVIRRINTTFVTPFDREDIHRLASHLDDVMDHIDATSDLIVLHNIDEPLPELTKQTDVLVRATATALEAIERLRTMRGLEPYWVEINRLENEGDRIYRRTVAHLFSGDYKAMDVLKHKDVTEQIEEAIDSLEGIAHVLEAIVLKNA